MGVDLVDNLLELELCGLLFGEAAHGVLPLPSALSHDKQCGEEEYGDDGREDGVEVEFVDLLFDDEPGYPDSGDPSLPGQPDGVVDSLFVDAEVVGEDVDDDAPSRSENFPESFDFPFVRDFASQTEAVRMVDDPSCGVEQGCGASAVGVLFGYVGVESRQRVVDSADAAVSRGVGASR